MPWGNPVLYFVVTATLTSFLELGNGRATAAVAALQRPRETNLDASLRSGTLRVGGSVHLRSVVLDVKNESVATTRNGSLAFDFGNQSDQNVSTAWHRLVEAKLKRMDPAVQCSDNSMTLKVKRVRAPYFLVDSGEGPPVPLSQMSSSCGFSVRRSRRDVHFVAPYQGCHVTQQGGNYVLPLRLWGAPMTMSCPVAPPPPSVSCFPSGMVVKIGGITTNELKVKVSGMWESLSSVCGSCGFAVDVLSGGLTLTAPYHKGLCIESKNDVHLLSLLLADVELLVTCPSGPDVKTTTATTTPSPSDSGQFLQYPQFPMFPQYPVIPGPPAPTTDATAQMPQHPMFQRPLHPSSMTTNTGPTTERQEVTPAQHPEIPFMPQYPLFPQYPMFPRPIPATQATPDKKNTAAPPGQFPQMPQSPQFSFPFFPQFPVVPGILHPTPPPATTTEALSTTPASTEDDVMPQLPQQPQFPVPPPYPFLPFPKFPLYPESHPQASATAVHTAKPVTQGPQQHHEYPQIYQIPVLYPPHNYPFQRQNVHPLKSQTAAPTTTPTTTAATTVQPPAQRPFYYPHPYMPVYYAPQQAPNPVFPYPSTTPPTTPASSDQPQPQNNYHPMASFHPFPHQKPNAFAGVTTGTVDHPKEHHKLPFMPYGALHRFGYGWNIPYAPYPH